MYYMTIMSASYLMSNYTGSLQQDHCQYGSSSQMVPTWLDSQAYSNLEQRLLTNPDVIRTTCFASCELVSLLSTLFLLSSLIACSQLHSKCGHHGCTTILLPRLQLTTIPAPSTSLPPIFDFPCQSFPAAPSILDQTCEPSNIKMYATSLSAGVQFSHWGLSTRSGGESVELMQCTAAIHYKMHYTTHWDNGQFCWTLAMVTILILSLFMYK